MKVHCTATAEGHLDAIYVYIAQDSKTYALRTVDRITSRWQQIAAFSMFGRHVSELVGRNGDSVLHRTGIGTLRPVNPEKSCQFCPNY